MATWILVSLLTTGLLLLSKVYWSRTRRSMEPPLLKGWLPFFGVVLDYGKNPLTFLQSAQQKYGEIFTCKMAGKYFTFITDPFSFSTVMRQGKNLDFQKFAMAFSQRVFGHADFTSPVYSESYRDVHSLFRQTLQGPSLQHLTQNMFANLQTVLCDSMSEEWHEEGLQCFTNRIMFEAGFITLFGKKTGLPQPETKVQRAKRDFMAFDGAFPLLAAGVPITLCRSAWWARKALTEELHHVKLNHRMCISELIQRRMEAFDRMHLDETGKAQTHVCMLWASQANTLPAAFWSLYYTLRSPEALAAARNEIDRIIQDSELNDENKPTNFSKEQLDSMTVLESIIKEALRLSSASMMIRVANDDFIVTLDSNQKAAIRKGDFIALYPPLIHQDPEVYPNPQEFKYKRFLDEVGEKRTFFKNGRPLKNFLLPFGSGASECPGRLFAMNELKQFLVLVLWQYEMHLSETDTPPSPDCTRAGLGILPPVQDVILRYRMRVNDKSLHNDDV